MKRHHVLRAAAMTGAGLLFLGVLALFLWSEVVGAALMTVAAAGLVGGWYLSRSADVKKLDPSPSAAEASPSRPLEYFCYISRTKVDQLYEQVDPEASDEVTELRSVKTTVGGEAKAEWGIPHIVKLFQTGASYGRTGLIQREAKIKLTYLRKLERVLLALAARGPIPDAAGLLVDDGRQAGVYHFHGPFEVEQFDQPSARHEADAVATIVSDLGGGRPLLLDCSLRYFSEGPLPDGTFALDSANMRFFEGDVALTMTTVFLLLENRPERVVGTPLFLKLALTNDDYPIMTSL